MGRVHLLTPCSVDRAPWKMDPIRMTRDSGESQPAPGVSTPPGEETTVGARLTG
jgi:hypothetical protein